MQQAITTIKATEATLNIRGAPSSIEGKDARQAMETRLAAAIGTRETLLDEIFQGVRVFISGGEEMDGNTLKDKLQVGANKALERIFKQFDIADDAGWGKVVDKARQSGGETALTAVNHRDDADKHPVCAQVIKYIGSGKKGSDVRENFQAAPFGWPQDTIDGALYALLASGHLKARNAANKPIDAKGLDRKNLTQTHFEVENVTISQSQKIAVRKLLVDTLGACPPGEEDAKINELLQYARDLAEKAGGDAPRPQRPDLARINEIAGEAGNSRMLKMHEYREELQGEFSKWQERAGLIESRIPNWSQLKSLVGLSRGLSFHNELAKEVDAIENGRRLLDEPDPVSELVNDCADNLRTTILHRFDQYKDTYTLALNTIESDSNWCKLDSAKQQELMQKRNVTVPVQPKLSSAVDVIESLEQCAIEQWTDRADALKTKFESAREEAAKFLLPKAVKAQLPNRTLEDEAAIEQWLADAETELRAKLKEGPVIV